jgi:hypothetical protein
MSAVDERVGRCELKKGVNFAVNCQVEDISRPVEEIRRCQLSMKVEDQQEYAMNNFFVLLC